MMERKKMHVKPTFLVTLMLAVLTVVKNVSSWSPDLRANLKLQHTDLQGIQVYNGDKEVDAHDYKVLQAENNWMILGSRNRMYNISMASLEENVLERIEWKPREFDKKVCLSKVKTEEECHNHIRVVGRKPSGELYVCGTNAFKPKCRTYVKSEEMTYHLKKGTEENGIGKCAFDPNHNSTAVFTADGKLFSATVADFSARDPLILNTDSGHMIRSEQHDSKWLNEPNFVSSFEINDQIYFFFRETAVENINCGKAVFSRVGRICKNDKGGKVLMKNLWTSFFKARLNCSIPGEYPFYFDEIQSTSEFNQGNYMSTTESNNRTKMFYAVFRTPANSIQASAVCAFKFSDIEKTFLGKFKGQESPYHNWLSVPHQETPTPHPSKCVNDTYRIPDSTLNFIKSHTLMDEAVPSASGSPIIVLPTFSGRLTQIAVDWQILSGDGRYYDIIFVGTDDGRVIKLINKGRGKDVESVIIEDIQIFPEGYAVTGLKIYKVGGKSIKLIVVSKEKVVSMPLHRCETQKSCRSCVKLQDPYCSWVDNKCAASERGFQSIDKGHHESCANEEITTLAPKTTPKPAEKTTSQVQCHCPCENGKDNEIPNVKPTKKPMEPIVDVDNLDNTLDDDIFKDELLRGRPSFKVEPMSNQNEDSDPKPSAQEVKSSDSSSISVATLAIAIVCAIVVSSILSFLAGYWVRSCRNEPAENQLTNEEIYGTLQKNHNKLKEEPRYVNHSQLERNNSQKQLNLLVTNIQKGSNLPNGGALQKPILNIPMPDKTYV